MHIAKLPAVDLHWREDGDPRGFPIVFANSLGTDLRLWDKIVPFLPQGLRMIRFDNRGHGLSSCPNGAYAMADLIEDTAGLLDHLGVETCVFVGSSIGGMIAQGLCAKQPGRIKALVLANTGTRMGEPQMWRDRISTIETGGIEAVADAVLDRWFAPAFRRTDEFAAWRNMLIRTPETGYIGCCHAIVDTDLAESTSTIAVPTIVIAGAQDGASSPDLVARTAALITGAQFHVIDGAGHLPSVEKPHEMASLVSHFLKEVIDA